MLIVFLLSHFCYENYFMHIHNFGMGTGKAQKICLGAGKKMYTHFNTVADYLNMLVATRQSYHKAINISDTFFNAEGMPTCHRASWISVQCAYALTGKS